MADGATITSHIRLDDEGRAWVDDTNTNVIEIVLDHIFGLLWDCFFSGLAINRNNKEKDSCDYFFCANTGSILSFVESLTDSERHARFDSKVLILSHNGST